MDDRIENEECIVERIKALPPHLQTAFIWLIDNIDTVDKIVEGQELTGEQTEQYIKVAHERKDYALLLLVMYKQKRDEQKKESEEEHLKLNDNLDGGC